MVSIFGCPLDGLMRRSLIRAIFVLNSMLWSTFRESSSASRRMLRSSASSRSLTDKDFRMVWVSNGTIRTIHVSDLSTRCFAGMTKTIEKPGSIFLDEKYDDFIYQAFKGSYISIGFIDREVGRAYLVEHISDNWPSWAIENIEDGKHMLRILRALKSNDWEIEPKGLETDSTLGFFKLTKAKITKALGKMPGKEEEEY